MKKFYVDKITVVATADRDELGEIAAENVSSVIANLLRTKDEIRMVFAAAPSQNEFLDKLILYKNIDWARVTAFHMDEYIGLTKNSPQLFSRYLDVHLFSKVNFKTVHLINSAAENLEEECKRYEELLNEKIIDIVCMGIGENGHIAFNDPPVADFRDKKNVKVVELDLPCRRQQVNDGCFNRIEDVPKIAITLTIPSLISGIHLSVVVPGKRKAEAVKKTLYGKVGTECPASVLRRHNSAILYIDNESASLL